MLSCTKRYDNFPFAHRQPEHKGHCSLIHGHNWSFEFEFRAIELDGNGFVIDFGSLAWLKTWLAGHFDHTLVLNRNDPYADVLQTMLLNGPSILARIKFVPNCGAEGLAKFVHDTIRETVQDKTSSRVRLHRVTVFEDDRNSATYTAK